MSLSEKYPNLEGDESPQQIVREVLSSVGIVNDAKVTGVVVDLIDELFAPLKSHLDTMRTELTRLNEENAKLSSELAALKSPAPPANTPDPPTPPAPTTEPTKENA